MSLLGFDALGRTGLGNTAKVGATNTIFAVAPASYAYVGGTAFFRHRGGAVPAAFAVAGNEAASKVALSSGVGSGVLAGRAVSASVSFSSAVGRVGLVGLDVLATTKMASSGIGFVVEGQAARCMASMSARGDGYVVSAKGIEFGRGFDNWFTLPRDGGQWTARRDPESVWQPLLQQVEAWSLEASGNPSWMVRSRSLDAWTNNAPAKKGD